MCTRSDFPKDTLLGVSETFSSVACQMPTLLTTWILFLLEFKRASTSTRKRHRNCSKKTWKNGLLMDQLWPVSHRWPTSTKRTVWPSFNFPPSRNKYKKKTSFFLWKKLIRYRKANVRTKCWNISADEGVKPTHWRNNTFGTTIHYCMYLVCRFKAKLRY